MYIQLFQLRLSPINEEKLNTSLLRISKKFNNFLAIPSSLSCLYLTLFLVIASSLSRSYSTFSGTALIKIAVF